MITLQFLAGMDFSSNLISWFGGGPAYSHVDAVLADGRLLGARQEGGVAIRAADYYGQTKTLRVEIPTTTPQTDRFWNFIDQQIGKPYDSKAIIGFVVGRDWRDPGSWFCSELIAAGLEEADLVHKLACPANKVTPADLVLILSAMFLIEVA
jgi:hypothetical protein